MPAELRERFSRKQWKDCCGKGCKKCEIAQTYIGEYGRDKGLKKLNEDRAVTKKAKKKAKTGAKGGRKKAKKT
jgi:hypothetical protein